MPSAKSNAARGRQPSRRKPSPLPEIGTALRLIIRRLKVVESSVIVCRMALDGQASDQDTEVSAVLKRVVGGDLFEQIRDLENVAAQCDGGAPSDRNDDEAIEAGGEE